jgi:hypothetical protein
MLHIVHRSHQGIDARNKRARAFMFWFGMMKNVHVVVEKCTICAMNNIQMNH